MKSNKLFFGLTLLMALMAISTSLTATIYVDANANGNDDGSSWVDAYVYLQDAFDEANANGTTDYEIRIAQGVYYPDLDNNGGHTDNSEIEFFRFNYDNIALYGGYPTGGGTRDPETYLTILSGDIDSNDTNSDGNNIAEDWDDIVGSNSNNILYVDGVVNESITDATIIDGITVTAGRGDAYTKDGCAMYLVGNASGRECSPTLVDCNFFGNWADDRSAIYLYSENNGTTNPTFTDCNFSGNRADGSHGGGVISSGWMNSGGTSSPTFIDCIFSGNYRSSTSYGGGAIAFFPLSGAISEQTYTNCLFTGNKSGDDGGVFYYYTHTSGGYRGSLDLINCTFTGNYAADRGAVLNITDYTTPSIDVTFTNSILQNNASGGGTSYYYVSIRTQQENPYISYTNIDWGSSTSWPSKWIDGGNNIDLDPCFVTEVNPATAPTSLGNFLLESYSPSLGTGLDPNGSNGVPYTDIVGTSRPFGSGTDMGAYEQFDEDTPTPVTLTNFSSVMVGDFVNIFWTVESESNLSNYNLLRSENDEAQVLIYSVNAENLSTTHTYEYHDYEVEPGTYTYWLESVENDGSFTVYDPCSITVVEGEQPGDDDDDVTTRLMGNYPNPFTGVTEIFFNLGTDEVENIEIEIYNMRGQLVKQCAVPNDQSSVSWSAANKATGVYIYKLVVDGKEVDAGKMILSK
ncbi:MAG: T9SS type A sorting domain-containing protein [Candidatus Cloacimonetes bacterium]|jgi:hypothetical protein|nr:T9SS type A sorting domain-containing protein [Candidatus Cloacimonadota bacterium]